MKSNKKWVAVLSIALSLPSSIAAIALFMNELVDKGILDIKVAFSIFLLVISGMIWLMIVYAFSKKN